MIYLLKMMIFHGYVSHNQRVVAIQSSLPYDPRSPPDAFSRLLGIALEAPVGSRLGIWRNAMFFFFRVNYPLVNVYITMGNHHAMKMGIHQLNFDWAMASIGKCMLNYQRVWHNYGWLCWKFMICGRYSISIMGIMEYQRINGRDIMILYL